MMKEETELENRIASLLKGLRDVAPRNSQAFARGRVNFLAQARTIAQDISQESLVSITPKGRLIGWINCCKEHSSVQIAFRRKEHKPMLTSVFTFLVTLTLLFGGAGATVYAAQSSLPDEALYPVKTLSEDLQLHLATKTQNQLALALEFANRRVQEIANMSNGDKSIPSDIATRMQQHMELALQLAAGMDNTGMLKALEQICTALRNQEQTMMQLQNSQPGDPLLEQLRLHIREQLRLAEIGLSDPQGYKEQIRLRNQNRQEIRQGAPEEPPAPGSGGNQSGAGQPVVEPPQNGNDSTPGPQASPEPGSGPGPGPQSSPEPGSGPGPGPQSSPDPGSGPGSGPQASPEPGSGSGSGSGTDGDNGSGQDGSPESPGSGQGSGNGNGGHP